MDIHNYIPTEIINFFLVLIFSLLIGLAQRRHHMSQDDSFLFGTDRTFTFIGLLGYVLYVSNPNTLIPFISGLFVIGFLLGIQYFHKIRLKNDFGITSSVLALLTYCISIMVFTQPNWLVLSFVVSIMILTEMKSTFLSISRKASDEEFITLAKFIAFAGIILPLLPSKDISSYIPVSPYDLWLAIVVVSGVSYASYLLKKFIFPDSGILITGVLGGIYSSTATTVILARRDKNESTGAHSVSAIMLANGMMYLRVLVLVYVFNTTIGLMLTIPFFLMFGIAFLLSRLVLRNSVSSSKNVLGETGTINKRNPLELKTAVIFGVLFVLFGLITQTVLNKYGNTGVSGLAFFIGVFDIDPFLLYLLQQHAEIVEFTVAIAIFNATNSNNLMKMFYALTLCNRKSKKMIWMSFLSLIACGLLGSFVFYLVYK